MAKKSGGLQQASAARQAARSAKLAAYQRQGGGSKGAYRVSAAAASAWRK